MFEQMPSPESANITLPFGGLINVDFCRCIEMFTPRCPSVCSTCSLTCSKQQLVWLSISLLRGYYILYISLLFSEIFFFAKDVASQGVVLHANGQFCF